VDGARSPVRGMDPNAVTPRTAVELDEGRDVERVLQTEPAPRASRARGRAAANRDHRVAWLSDEPAREVLRATVHLHGRAAVTEARTRRGIGKLKRFRTGTQLTQVVPAIDVEAARQRAVDDGAEQPVIILSLDDEAEPHLRRSGDAACRRDSLNLRSDAS